MFIGGVEKIVMIVLVIIKEEGLSEEKNLVIM